MNYINKLNAKNIILFSVLFFVFLTFELVYFLFGGKIENLNENMILLLTLSKYFFLIIIFLLHYFSYLKEKIVDFFKHFKNYFAISFKDWLTGFIIMYMSNIIIMRFIGGLGANEESVQNLISQTPLIALIITTFLGPFIEEMLFRKSLQDCFNNKTLFMIISGFIFGFIHVMGGPLIEYLLIIPYGALGFMFAHTLNKTDNIFCSILMHMLHNGILTLLVILW